MGSAWQSNAPQGLVAPFLWAFYHCGNKNGVMLGQLLQLNRDATGIAVGGGINFI